MRLIEMGVEPYLVASALTLVAAQRLARKLCDRCAQAVGPAEVDQLARPRRHRRDPRRRDRSPRGRLPGLPQHRLRGRLPILEIMPVSEQISRLILDRAPRAQIERLAVEEGMETMTTAAMRRVAARRSLDRRDDANRLLARRRSGGRTLERSRTGDSRAGGRSRNLIRVNALGRDDDGRAALACHHPVVFVPVVVRAAGGDEDHRGSRTANRSASKSGARHQGR